MVQVARLLGSEVVGLDATAAKLHHLRDELGIEVLDSRYASRHELVTTPRTSPTPTTRPTPST
jgi:NADPH-dependent curcumin reductase CurA